VRRPVLLISSLLLGAGALWDASRQTWLCDDAFISFRYAHHLVAGEGLVFNPGERVEGYTNFLWTLLLAAAEALGVAPEASSVLLGLLAFTGLLVLVARTSTAIARDHGRELPWVSVALAGLALHLHHRLFATSGLETGLFTLLVTATVVAAVEARGPRSWGVVGLLGSLATLTRPEGALVYGLSSLAALAGARPRRRHLLAAWAPGVLLLLPWAAWKLVYYGDLLPNTFYAKDAGEAQWAEGAAYVGLYLGTYLALVPALAAAVLGPLLGRWSEPGWAGRRAGVLVGGLTLAWLVHVLRVGGDFMFARFLLPITPLLLLALERWLGRLREVPGTSLGLALACGLGLSVPPAGLLEDDGIGGVVEERNWYPESWREEARRQGAVLRRVLEGSDARVVFYGTQAMLMFYGEVPYALEGHVGLTDREIARNPPPAGTRIAHGKKATLDYLRSREIDFVLAYRLQLPAPELTRLDLGEGVRGRLVTYRSGVAEQLRANGARFVDFEAFLDHYLADIDHMPREKVEREYVQFRGYYFDHNDDPTREASFEARLADEG